MDDVRDERPSSLTRPTVVLVGPRAHLRGGVATHVVTHLAGELARRFDLVHLGLGYWDEPVGVSRRIRDGLAKVPVLRSMLAASGPAVVHLNPSMDVKSVLRETPLAVTAKRSGARVLVQFHGGGFTGRIWTRYSPLRIVLRRLVAAADEVIVLSGSQWEKLVALCPDERDKIRVVRALFVDTDRFAPAMTERERRGAPLRSFLFVGRLSKEKGVFELVDAFRAVHARHDDTSLRIAGAGPDAGAIRSRVSDLGPAVSLEGFVMGPERDRLLAEADVFVLPSWSEGLPIALIEAMAAGLPVIVSDAGGMPEIVVDGVHGFVIPRRDPSSLTERMLWVIERPTEAAAMGRRNQLVAQDFSLRRQTSVFGDIYGRLLGSGRSASGSDPLRS